MTYRALAFYIISPPLIYLVKSIIHRKNPTEIALLYSLNPKFKVTLFEKEYGLGLHLSGYNSGILHCGLYYQYSSLKAKLAVDGIREIVTFCGKIK